MSGSLREMGEGGRLHERHSRPSRRPGLECLCHDDLMHRDHQYHHHEDPTINATIFLPTNPDLDDNDHDESCGVIYLPIEDVCQIHLKANLSTCAVSSGEEPSEENPINWVSVWCLHWGPVQPGLYSEDKIHSNIYCGCDGAQTVRTDSLCC